MVQRSHFWFISARFCPDGFLRRILGRARKAGPVGLFGSEPLVVSIPP